MCVILICPPKVRPNPDVLFACDAANPHGAGMAWRSKGRVHWLKNASVSDLLRELPKIKGEIVIHFRWASVGGVDARLCHPFPVTPRANVSLRHPDFPGKSMTSRWRSAGAGSCRGSAFRCC